MTKTAVATSDDPFDPAAIRRLAAAVEMGECITFPNGVTIDKRPLTSYYHYSSQTTPVGASLQPSWWWGTVNVPPAGGSMGTL